MISMKGPVSVEGRQLREKLQVWRGCESIEWVCCKHVTNQILV